MKHVTLVVLTVLLAGAAAAVLLIGGDTVTLDSHLHLSEVCPHNVSVVADEEGDTYDFAVLRNPTDQDISLAGWAISDYRKNIRLHEFTEGTVPAHGEKLIWISKSKTGFALSNNEVLYLSDPEGRVVDKCGLPRLNSNEVYVRGADRVWHVGASAYSGLYAEPPAELLSAVPALSHESGFYDQPFFVALSAPDDCEILYTTDGTDPRSSGKTYSAPIRMEDRSAESNVYAAIRGISLTDPEPASEPVVKGTILRAVCRSTDGLYGEETRATYFVGITDAAYRLLPTVSLIMNPEDLFSASRGIYVIGKLWTSTRKLGKYNIHTVPVNYNQDGKDWRREATAEMFDENGALTGTEQVRVSIHGGYSATNNQKSLNLFSRDGSLFGDVFGYRSKTLFLRAVKEPTMLRDVLVQRLMDGSAVCTLGSVPVQVFLNGEYWGLYHLTERIDQTFVQKRFSLSDEALILKNENSVGGNDKKDYAEYEKLVAFAETQDLNDPQCYAQLSEMMDLQSYMEYISMQVYIANADCLGNNHGRWRSRETDGAAFEDGRWRWIAYDLDDSSEANTTPGFYSADTNSFAGGIWSSALLKDRLFSSLMKSGAFCETFRQTFTNMARTTFAFDRVDSLLTELSEKIAPQAVESRRRFYDEDYTAEDYAADVEVLRGFYRDRGPYILRYMEEVFGEEEP